MQVRPILPSEYEALGRLTVVAYTSLPGAVREPDYEVELADVAAKLTASEVIVAVEDGSVLGGVAFVGDVASPMHEFDDDRAASFRHLAVDPAAQGKGVGQALVTWCLERSRALGFSRVLIHTTPWMLGAHRLYERNGFVRDPTHDWTPVPDVPLLAYRLEL